MFSSSISVLTLVAVVVAKTISIDVGNGALNFNPNSTTADVGDMLEFHFYSFAAPHSVVMGAYDSPCMPAPGAFFSNYINGTSSGNETYIVPVTTTSPIWIYCSAHKHCQNGMVGVINPPLNATVDQYAAAAKSVSSNVAPATTMVSGSYTTIPASMTSGTSSMSMTGSSSMATGTSAGAASGSSSAKASSTSIAAGPRQTMGVMGLVAAGGLAAMMV